MTDHDDKFQAVTEKRLGVLLHAGFLVIGILTVLLGQILPFLTKELAITDEQAGYLFVAQFVGSLTGAFSYNRTIKTFGYPKMLFGGFCLMAAGCFGLNVGSWFGCLAAIFIYGIGIGATIPAVNLLIIELNHERTSSASNIINFFWGIGAISCKPFVDFIGSPKSILLPTILLGIAFLLVGAAILFSNYREISAANADDFDAVPIKIWTQPTAWLLAVFNFVHVGIESSVAGWLTTYEIRLTDATFNRWISAALVYFLLLVIGRGIAPLFFRFWRDNVVMFGSLIVMTGGILLILLTEDFTSLTVGAAILGFGTASVFPMNIARFMKFFGADATKNATPLFVMGSFGGAFATWFIGFTSTNFNSLRAGFSVILISCLSLLVLQIVLSKKLS
ncbi:MAG: MFS transporter, partial [Pyrinomonadaceae bacterium]|nr:MFS transporter [Pyrinomonadaceae bacterium]